MTTLPTRISLQQSRFQLIQHAMEIDNDETTSPLMRQVLNTRLEMLERNWLKFQEEHEDLCHSEHDSFHEHQYMKTRTYERCHEFYVHARANLLTRRDEIDESLPAVRSVSSEVFLPSTVNRRLSALPKITLPKFSGNFQEWRSYHDLFTSLIRNNAELSNVERMHYLKTSLSGEALRYVANLPVSGDSFSIAWETLSSRYENKRFLVTAHLDQLTNMKPLKTKSASVLSSLLANISETLGALRALGCSVEFWDPLLLHLLVKLLDTESREAWELKLGPTTNYPTFSEFEEFLIGRARAMQNLTLPGLIASTNKDDDKRSKSRSRFSTNAQVATCVAKDPAICPLCTSSHYLARCTTFLTKTPSQRLEIVKKHKKCFNCLGNHAIRQCKSTKRCQKCGKHHHTTLHNSAETSPSKAIAVTSAKTKESDVGNKMTNTSTD